MQNSILTRGNVQVSESEIVLGTGNSSRQLSTLSEIITETETLLSEYGQEGSAVKLTGLNPGVYTLQVSLYSRELQHNDSLYAGNGKKWQKIASREGAAQESSTVWKKEELPVTVEIVYDWIAFIALDAESRTGSTDFKISNFQYFAPLPYLPPEPVSLIPTITVGDVKIENICRITTGTNSRAMSTLSLELTGDRSLLNDYGIEGSLANWLNLEPGIYEVKWKLHTAEDETIKDAVYIWVSNQLTLLGDRSLATNQVSSTRFESDWIVTEIEVYDGQLGFVAVDTGDGTGTTELRISGIERVAELPTEPIPDMGHSPATAWDMGTRYPEGQESEGINWNHGVISGSDHSGINTIRESIGGDDVVDYVVFNLAIDATLRLTTNNAIAALLNSEANSVIWDSDDAYQSDGTVQLTAGKYYIQYSSESSIPEEFTSTLYLI